WRLARPWCAWVAASSVTGRGKERARHAAAPVAGLLLARQRAERLDLATIGGKPAAGALEGHGRGFAVLLVAHHHVHVVTGVAAEGVGAFARGGRVGALEADLHGVAAARTDLGRAVALGLRGQV